jgi:(E)-4-hydroxy-3-methylbut-2-enyl-diphosphate synthase
MLYNYQRRKTHEVHVGGLTLGGDAPIRLQSMTNTSTADVAASVAQVQRIVEAGADLVRLTAQGSKEVQALSEIEAQLRATGCATPLVADIHFNPALADAAAGIVEKVRINPGNYVDAARTFRKIEYTDEAYRQELERLRARFSAFLALCRAHHTAIRIGVNHGSLSDRIMSRYGDTPAGIVESCMEFLRVCKAEHFDDVVLSIKASNTRVMVTSVRLLVQQMELEGMDYPLHLGVTEAGDGEDGRIKSAVGIGALLADGLGDTIRVSLSEAPEAEIPVARKLVEYISARAGHNPIAGPARMDYNPVKPERRPSQRAGIVGDGQVPVVCGNVAAGADLSAEGWRVLQLSDFEDPTLLTELKEHPETGVILRSEEVNPIGCWRSCIFRMMEAGCMNSILLSRTYHDTVLEDFQLKAAADFGVMLLDELIDGVYIVAPNFADEVVVATSLSILQAARQRFSKTEYIACPSCGRTLFDLTTTLAEIRRATAHLTGLKIGVMGCIVNGPGEMADADYGYVGAGPGKVSLYKGKVCVERGIPAEHAVARLLELIDQDRK